MGAGSETALKAFSLPAVVGLGDKGTSWQVVLVAVKMRLVENDTEGGGGGGGGWETG